MTLVSETCDLVDDTITFSDLQNHLVTTTPECPYCGRNFAKHETAGDAEDHDHKPIDGLHTICRRLYECQYVSPFKSFYFYADVEDLTRWVTVQVKQVVEPVDDTEDIRFGRKKLAEPIKPTWRFRTKLATSEDYTGLLEKNLVLGLELELDFADENHPVSNSTISSVFKVEPTDYHHPAQCPNCGREGCWNHLPENLIRAIERDASINGWEFIFYGSTLSSEEFAKRLPMDKLKRYFVPNERDGLHVHAMLVHDIPKIPNVIVKNIWQLFRYYYPAFTYLFGNQKRDHGFIRYSFYNGHDYTKFVCFNKSPYSKKWATDMNDMSARAGLWLVATPIGDEMMDEFDVEVRMMDSTYDVEQILSARSIMRALVLRAAQLSTFGLISVETNKATWDHVKATINKINQRELTPEDEAFMKQHTIALLRELAPFLSEFERACIKHLIENPVRDRKPGEVTSQHIVREISDTAKHLKRLITLGSIEAENEEAWLSKVGLLLSLDPKEVKMALRELKAYFDLELKAMVLVQ